MFSFFEKKRFKSLWEQLHFENTKAYEDDKRTCFFKVMLI